MNPEAEKTSFWNRNSHLTPVYDKLFEKLIPATGKAKTTHGELLRCISRIYYDCYNNGGCNMHLLRNELRYIWTARNEIIPKMEDPETFRHFMLYLRGFSKSNRGYLPKNWSERDLEDITEAIVKVVAESDTK